MTRIILAKGTGPFKDKYLSDPKGITEVLPKKVKQNILEYLKTQVTPYLIGAFYVKDPLTDRVIAEGNSIYENNGYTWSTEMIYLFEKYNIKLDDEFKAGFLN